MDHYAFNWFALPPLITALSSLAVGIVLLRREWRSRVGQAMFLVTLAITLWFGCTACMYCSVDAATALMWAHGIYITFPLLPAAFFFYVSVGLRFYENQKYVVWTTLLASFIFVALSFGGDLLLSGVQKHWWGYYPTYGLLGPVFVAFFALVIVLGLMLLHAVLRDSPKGSLSRHRTQLSLVLIGIASVAVVDFIPKFGASIYPFGFVPILLFLGMMYMVEMRHRVVYMTPAFAAGQILDTMQGAVLVATPEGHVEVSNRGAAALLGYPEVGDHDLDLDAVFAGGDDWRSLLQSLTAGEPVRAYETRWTRKDGGAVDVSLSASLLTESKSKTLPVGVVFAAVDITERKKAELALRLSEEQLRQSQKMEAIGQLAGGIAHDFNNMLTAIIGNTSLVLNLMGPDDPNRPLIVDIQEVGERAAALTRQILAFSRRQVLKPEVLDLNRVVVDMQELLRRSIGEDVELELLLAPDLRTTEVDRHQIGQVILNLAVNARDAMPGGGRLLIETRNISFGAPHGRHSEMRAGDYVVLVVTDNGCGMDQHTQAHLFEPFFTTKGVGNGTGLGLSTVFGIVKQSGGGIYVYSEVGAGSTFKVYMPASASGVEQGQGPAGRQTPGHRGSERILLVEDEAQVRELVVRVLSRYGYEVKAAGSADGVEEILDGVDYRPDLVLTDVVLPGGVNGRQVADRMTRRFPGVKVLFMSGYTRNAVVHDGRLDEGIAFLEKPFTPDTLLRKVRETMDAQPEPTLVAGP